MTKFTLHEDPGHGWLEVTKQQAATVGLVAGDFSKYSYREGDTWYLEEDCDLAKFARAFHSKHDRSLSATDITTVYSDNASPIRRLARLA